MQNKTVYSSSVYANLIRAAWCLSSTTTLHWNNKGKCSVVLRALCGFKQQMLFYGVLNGELM